MLNDSITVLEVNSVTLRLVHLKKTGRLFYPVFTRTEEYAGIENGMLSKPDRLFVTLSSMFNSLFEKYPVYKKEINVILPQMFFSSIIEEVDIAIIGKAVIGRDVDNLYAKCIKVRSGHTVIDHKPIRFRTINEPNTDNPIGQECERLYGEIVTVGLDVRVKEFFDNLAKSIKKEFIYTGEGMSSAYLLDNKLKVNSRLRCIICMRQEHISVCLVNGKAIISSRTVDWGAKHILKSIQDLLNINPDMAEQLLNKINLNVAASADNQYIINYNGRTMFFDMKQVNDRVIQTFEYIFSLTAKEAADYFKDDNYNIPIYLTGDDICGIKGVAEILSANVETTMAMVISSDYQEYTTEGDYCLTGLIEEIIDNITKNSISVKASNFFRRIKNGI